MSQPGHAPADQPASADEGGGARLAASAAREPGTAGAPLGPWWREPTRGQWATLLATYSGWVLDAFDFTIYFMVMPEIIREFGVSRTAAASSITLTLLLRLVGGVAAGWAADRWGRRLPLMLSLVWFAIFDGLVAVAPTFTWVLVLRTLFGFGMGAEWAAGTTLAMENWPARSRGIASGILQGGLAVGYLLAAVVSALVVPRWGWRALFALAALPALLVIPIRVFVPESETWRRRVGGGPEPPPPSYERPSPEPGIFSARKLLPIIVWSTLLMGFGAGAYYGIAAFYPTLLQGPLGLSKGDAAQLVVVLNVGILLGTAVWGVVAARFSVVLAIVIPALSCLAVFPLYVGSISGWLWLGALLVGALGVGLSGVVPLLLTALFPAEVRARSVGFVYHAGSCLGALTPPIVAALTERLAMPLARAIPLVAGSMLVGMAALLALRPRAAQLPDASADR